jgi:hypothetical protein
VSEHPRDDDELRAFLERDSALSRRYREVSDEQPPAKVDAAILAASQWAVGADMGQVSQRPASAHRDGAAHAVSKRRPSVFSRWSIPLATAAVVVVAATLTLMIERDPGIDRPGIDRMERQHDAIALNAPEEATEQTSATSDEAGVDRLAASSVPPVSMPAAAKLEQVKPAPPRARSEQAVPSAPSAATSAAPKRLEFRPVQGGDAATKKEAESTSGRSETSLGEAAAKRADSAIQLAQPARAPAPSAEEKSASADIAGPVVRRRDTDASLARDVPSGQTAEAVMAESEMPSTVPAGKASNAEPADTQLADEGTSIEATIDERNAATAAPAAQSAPVQRATAVGPESGARDPEEWIADIEEQLAKGNRELAKAAVKNFRSRYPDYKLPDALEKLLPDSGP